MWENRDNTGDDDAGNHDSGSESARIDPWSQVHDIDGDLHYRVLGINQTASSSEVKQAYIQAARVAHPDKGGSTEAFAAVQKAYGVLSDPARRAVYDTWAKDLEWRYIKGVAPRAQGGEDKLLDEFETLGLHCNPLTQLIITCEICRRPSNKQCWTCGMQICDFCTMKRHWKGSHGLHWPLINSNHMMDVLGKRQMEEKKKDDAKRHMLEDPNYRSEHELKIVRDFKAAAARMLGCKDRLVTYDLRLAQFYMWAQTNKYVFIACSIPTGYQDKEVVVDLHSGNCITIQPKDSPPLLERVLEHPMDPNQAVESFRTSDNRIMVLSIAKGVPGEVWRKVFRGDSDGARCLEPVYTLTELDDEVILELEVPFWIEADDIAVDIDDTGLHLSVRSNFDVKRRFWVDNESGSKAGEGGCKAVNPSKCSWVLEDDVDAQGQRCKVLSVSMVKPPVPQDDVLYKKGSRSDHRSKEREGSMTKKGWRFFQDDEDLFGLEDVLQAICFMQSGSTYSPAKPWNRNDVSKTVTDVALLSAEVQDIIERLLDGAERARRPDVRAEP